jgi:hypothetical protein
VAIANLAHAREITRHSGSRAQGGADHRLGDESDDGVAAELLDPAFELAGQARAIVLRRLLGPTLAIFVDRRDMVRLDQQRSELLTLPFPAAGRQRAERAAVIALAARDDVSPMRLPKLDEVLARELEGSLDRFRPAADEEDAAHARRRVGAEIGSELLRDRGGEEAGMRIGQSIELLAHGRQNIRVRMPEAGHRGPAGSVDVLVAGSVADDHAAAGCGHGIGMPDLAMQYMGHDRDLPPPPGQTRSSRNESRRTFGHRALE